MISAIQRLEDGTISLTVTVPSKRVLDTKEEVIASLVEQAELPGFRKGKAPRDLVESKLEKEKVNEEILRKLLPQTYLEAVNEHNLKPIVSPQIHITTLEDGKDWQYTALTCEAPTVDLGSYKESIKNITAKSKIVVPGKEQQPVSFEELTKALLSSATVKVPKLIVQGETDRLLSQTLDEVKKLGMTLDQYLSSTGKTPEGLRAEYETKATNDIKLEFALQKVADSEKINVTDEEIAAAVKEAKTEEERKSLEANKYLLATIIRQRKTLEFLRSL